MSDWIRFPQGVQQPSYERRFGHLLASYQQDGHVVCWCVMASDDDRAIVQGTAPTEDGARDAICSAIDALAMAMLADLNEGVLDVG